MKLVDLKQLSNEGKIQLSEWVLDGKHYPEVEIFHDKKTNTGYQLYEPAMLYRKTEEKPKEQNAFEYERKWVKLEG